MTDHLKLLFGPYSQPALCCGDTAFCLRHGEVTICQWTSGLIPWPIGKRKGGRSRVIVLCGDLVEAVRRESEQVVAHWWGVSLQTVFRWRKTLGVPAKNEGTLRRMSDIARAPAFDAYRAKAVAVAGDPVRREKIGAARRGKPRSAEAIEAAAAARRGSKLSEETRRKMSESHKRRGTWPPKAGCPWTAEEDDLVRTLPVQEVISRTGRTWAAVHSRRAQLGLTNGGKRGKGCGG